MERLTAKVTLKPRFEADIDSNVRQDLKDDYNIRRAGLGHLHFASGTRKDEHRNYLDRHGYWVPIQHRPQPALIYEPHPEKLININPMDVVNPDHDILAPGVCTIRVETTETNAIATPKLAWAYCASGKACGTISVARLALIHKAFKHTQQHRPEVHARFNNPQFENAVMKLLSRYKHGHKQGNKETKQAQEWSTPDRFMEAM